MKKQHILLIEDQTLVRQGLSALLNSSDKFQTYKAVASVREGLKILSNPHTIDVVLCDFNLKGHTAHDLLCQSHQIDVPPVILITSLFNAIELQQCLTMGAKGFLYKECDLNELEHALTAVAAGGVYFTSPTDYKAPTNQSHNMEFKSALTMAESETLTWLATGMSNKQIANTLGKSNETIKAHVSSILSKLNCKTRTQAVITAAKLNLI